MRFRDKFFLLILVLLCVWCIGYSFLRFMVVHDYMITYQGKCDPTVHTCFVSCSDDACTSNEYYDKVQKYAVNIYAQCGSDITNCDDANLCLPQHDQKCFITYCDPKIDGSSCETPDEMFSMSSTTAATSTTDDTAL